MVETFYDLDELEAAIEAVRGVSSLPIVATLTFDEGAETLAGVTAAEAAARLRPLDWPRSARTTAPACTPRWRRSSRWARRRPPLAALPNVGLASLAAAASSTRMRRRSTSPSSQRTRATGRAPNRRLLRHDADRDRRDRLRGRGGAEAERAAGRRSSASSSSRTSARCARDRAGARAARGRVGHCVELDPPKGGTYDAMLAVARELKRSGKVGFVDINDNPMARARANALMAAVAIERDCGIETIPHVTPRDTLDHGPRVAAARRARRRRPQRARRDRRPARGRRLPGLARASTRSTRSACRRSSRS